MNQICWGFDTWDIDALWRVFFYGIKTFDLVTYDYLKLWPLSGSHYPASYVVYWQLLLQYISDKLVDTYNFLYIIIPFNYSMLKSHLDMLFETHMSFKWVKMKKYTHQDQILLFLITEFHIASMLTSVTLEHRMKQLSKS